MNENTKFKSIVSNEPIQEGLSFEEWKEYGRNLGRIEKIYMWKVGEWWAYGEINYGEKTSITKSDDWDGPSYQTCADAGWVFKKFHFSRRHENLSWSQSPFIRSVQNIANMYCTDAHRGLRSGPRTHRALRAPIFRACPCGSTGVHSHRPQSTELYMRKAYPNSYDRSPR